MGLSEFTVQFFTAARLEDLGEARLAALWSMLLGVGVTATILGHSSELARGGRTDDPFPRLLW